MRKNACDEYLSYHPDAQLEWAKEQKLSFDPRVTSVGRFLRLSSIDELPQLINVIKGDIVWWDRGPSRSRNWCITDSRPSLYKSVRPGITGLWQVSGRNDVGYDMRVGSTNNTYGLELFSPICGFSCGLPPWSYRGGARDELGTRVDTRSTRTDSESDPKSAL